MKNKQKSLKIQTENIDFECPNPADPNSQCTFITSKSKKSELKTHESVMAGITFEGKIELMLQSALIVTLILLVLFLAVMVPIGLLELFGIDTNWANSFAMLGLKIIMGTLALDALLAAISGVSLAVYWFVRDDLHWK